jgi:hypothetical protein
MKTQPTLAKLTDRLHRIPMKHLHRMHTAKRKQEKHLETGCNKELHKNSSTSKIPVQETGWGLTDSRCPSKPRKS